MQFRIIFIHIYIYIRNTTADAYNALRNFTLHQMLELHGMLYGTYTAVSQEHNEELIMCVDVPINSIIGTNVVMNITIEQRNTVLRAVRGTNNKRKRKHHMFAVNAEGNHIQGADPYMYFDTFNTGGMQSLNYACQSNEIPYLTTNQ